MLHIWLCLVLLLRVLGPSNLKDVFVKRFAIQQSSVESIKLVMQLKQKTDEKVRGFYVCVFNVIMYFGGK